jgi:hypothetical protein
MAEALAVVGLVSSIVQFIDFGTRIVTRLREFDSDTKECPKAFRDLRLQLPLIINTLERAQKHADSGYITDRSAKSLKPLIDECLGQVKLLEDTFNRIVPCEKSTTWRKRLQVGKSIAHDREVQRISSVLQRHMQVLMFHLSTSNFDMVSSLHMDSVTPSRQPVFMVPFDRDYEFVGRHKILEELSMRLNTQNHRAALAGIGAVG